MNATLRYKIGQMLLIGFEGLELIEGSPITHAIQDAAVGGIILFDYDLQKKQYPKNIQNPEQVRQLNHSLQAFNTQARLTQHQPPLPLIIAVDYEGGHVNRLKEECGFPKTISALEASALSQEEVFQAASAMARTLFDLGFNLDFAPVVDVNIDPNNPIIGKLDRSFSKEPQIVSDYALTYAKAFAQNHIQCVYKHFPGHGSSQQDSHLGFVDVTDTWKECELLPYQDLNNDAHPCQMIMTAHIVNKKLDPSGLPATLSYPILTGILRETLGFKGIVITDDMQMKAISDHYSMEKAITFAINAGSDMLIIGNQLAAFLDPKELIDHIATEVSTGNIDLKIIEAAYDRIVLFKKRLQAK